jgi:hypothetical protein
MSERNYQVRVAGLLRPEELQDRLGFLQLTPHQVRTVLVARFAGQHGLPEFLKELRGYGLEVMDVRRLSQSEIAETTVVGPTVTAELVPGQGSYELTVAGDLGAGVHAALTPYATTLGELHTVLRARTSRDVEFLDLVLLLESRGLRIASIAVVDEPPAVPRQRAAHHVSRKVPA